MNGYARFLSLIFLCCAGCAAPRPSPTSSQGPERPARIHTDLKIGIALGGGGANGLAHINMLEVFDELGIRPHRIAGTSIGAIMGALYASGKSAAEIRELVDTLVAQDSDSWRDLTLDRQAFRWLNFLDIDIGHGGLINGKTFVVCLLNAIDLRTFEEMPIPLTVVAADLWSRDPVLLSTGDVSAAVQASMAIPGLFTPVTLNERVLVDGGIVDPVPYEILLEDCDLVVAVNVISQREAEEDASLIEVMFASIRVMQTAILQEKLKRIQPDIFIDTRITGVRMLEFSRADEIYSQAQSAANLLRQQLIHHISERDTAIKQ